MAPRSSATVRENQYETASPPTSEISELRHKRERLLAIIHRQSLLQNENFWLASGGSSNFFFDMKRTMFDPEGAALLADLLFDAIAAEEVDYIGGLETGAIPIVAALCARSWPARPIKGFFVRKENKGTGPTNELTGCSKGDRTSSSSRMSRPPVARQCRQSTRRGSSAARS